MRRIHCLRWIWPDRLPGRAEFASRARGLIAAIDCVGSLPHERRHIWIDNRHRHAATSEGWRARRRRGGSGAFQRARVRGRERTFGSDQSTRNQITIDRRADGPGVNWNSRGPREMREMIWKETADSAAVSFLRCFQQELEPTPPDVRPY